MSLCRRPDLMKILSFDRNDLMWLEIEIIQAGVESE